MLFVDWVGIYSLSFQGLLPLPILVVALISLDEEVRNCWRIFGLEIYCSLLTKPRLRLYTSDRTSLDASDRNSLDPSNRDSLDPSDRGSLYGSRYNRVRAISAWRSYVEIGSADEPSFAEVPFFVFLFISFPIFDRRCFFIRKKKYSRIKPRDMFNDYLLDPLLKPKETHSLYAHTIGISIGWVESFLLLLIASGTVLTRSTITCVAHVIVGWVGGIVITLLRC